MQSKWPQPQPKIIINAQMQQFQLQVVKQIGGNQGQGV
jgi:hypothetical protein